MKHRVTFLVKPNTPPTVPEQFSLSPGSKDAAQNHIQIKDLHAARQEKWTIARSDVPSKLLDVITPLSELHIRWNSPQAFDSLDPFSSRIPAGLHVQASPQAEATTTDQLCKLLGTAFSTKSLCKNLNETFVDFPGKLQGFYSSHPSVIENAPEQLKGFVKQLVCKGKKPCLEEIERLAAPDYFDIDYSSRAMDVHALVVTAYWHKGPEEDGKWNHRVQQLYEGHRSEIGIIDQRQAIDDGKLSYGGVLAVLGESQELKPTFFSFPTRHHKNPGTYTGSFKEPEGLHPKFSLKIAKAKAPLPKCTLNAFFTIPKDFFIDKYQLADKQLLESLGLKSLKAFHGDADLEAPTWTQGRWGSSALFELDPKKVNENGQIDVEIPLHMRYQEPSFLSEYTPVHLPWPTVFWACSANPDYQKFMTNPFDRGYLGYDFAFPKDTSFHHLSPVNGPTYSSVEVPVLEMKNASMVQMGTAAAVGVGFLYVVAKVVGSFKKSDPKKKAE